MIELGGEWSLHNDIRAKITPSFLKHLKEVLDNLIVGLQDRGWDKLETWVSSEDEKSIKLSEKMGFWPTGQDKLVSFGDDVMRFTVLRINFPETVE